MSNSSLISFVKWAGGKRQLLPQIRERMLQTFNRYFEPFVGGGAVIFEFLPPKAVINDINRALINTYRQIKVDPNDFLGEIEKIDNAMWKDGKEYYYSMR